MPQSPEQRAAKADQLDRFTELLSLDLPLSVIAERMGIRRPRASQLLMEVRKRLGPQAV